MSARSVLEAMGFEPHRARTLAMRFRRHSVQQLHELAPHFRDESKLISLARAGRQQIALEEGALFLSFRHIVI